MAFRLYWWPYNRPFPMRMQSLHGAYRLNADPRMVVIPVDPVTRTIRDVAAQANTDGLRPILVTTSRYLNFTARAWLHGYSLADLELDRPTSADDAARLKQAIAEAQSGLAEPLRSVVWDLVESGRAWVRAMRFAAMVEGVVVRFELTSGGSLDINTGAHPLESLDQTLAALLMEERSNPLGMQSIDAAPEMDKPRPPRAPLFLRHLFERFAPRQ